jgi:hypothetical protein
VILMTRSTSYKEIRLARRRRSGDRAEWSASAPAMEGMSRNLLLASSRENECSIRSYTQRCTVYSGAVALEITFYLNLYSTSREPLQNKRYCKAFFNLRNSHLINIRSTVARGIIPPLGMS